jgi:AraC-like DNA-binding protein
MNMANTTDPAKPQIVYSAVSKRVIEGELFIRQHVVDYIISGSSEVHFGGKSFLYKAGDFRFAVKNRLSKFTKIPPPGGEYRSISICIDQQTLFEMKDRHRLSISDTLNYENVFPIEQNKLFKNYIESLSPYLEYGNNIDAELLKTKIKEAVYIFTKANPALADILFDFSEPGKIDLQAYMDAHYQYNGDLQHFAYLTGRSLSTFKRDFEKIYHITPSRWLIKKRLEDAHYLLKEKKLKAKDVYVEVGFKDYSHFFLAFKKLFGIAPSML